MAFGPLGRLHRTSTMDGGSISVPTFPISTVLMILERVGASGGPMITIESNKTGRVVNRMPVYCNR